MKNTRKGFTLIELIVVIAIIGVLAALLVPAMMGYIKKGKISAANTDAETIFKAANSALEGLEEIDIIFSENGTYHHLKGDAEYKDLDKPVENDANTIFAYMELYFDGVQKTEFSVYINRGLCLATAARNGSYYGTRPIVYSAKNYDDFDHQKDRGTDGALIDAVQQHKIYYPGVVEKEDAAGGM